MTQNAILQNIIIENVIIEAQPNEPNYKTTVGELMYIWFHVYPNGDTSFLTIPFSATWYVKAAMQNKFGVPEWIGTPTDYTESWMIKVKILYNNYIGDILL